MTEEWKTISEFPGYEVSDLGRVRNIDRGNILAPGGHTYQAVSLPGRTVYVHVLVCTAFHGPKPVGMEVDHVDDDKQNNRADNLRWVTKSQNHPKRVVSEKKHLNKMMYFSNATLMNQFFAWCKEREIAPGKVLQLFVESFLPDLELQKHQKEITLPVREIKF